MYVIRFPANGMKMLIFIFEVLNFNSSKPISDAALNTCGSGGGSFIYTNSKVNRKVNLRRRSFNSITPINILLTIDLLKQTNTNNL